MFSKLLLEYQALTEYIKEFWLTSKVVAENFEAMKKCFI